MCLPLVIGPSPPGPEHVDAANDEHIIAASSNSQEPAQRSATLTWLTGNRGKVSRAVTDDGHGLLAQRCQNQFSLGIVWKDITGPRIDNLGIEMIFEDMQPIMAPAFHRHAWTGNFG